MVSEWDRNRVRVKKVWEKDAEIESVREEGEREAEEIILSFLSDFKSEIEWKEVRKWGKQVREAWARKLTKQKNS